MQNILDANSSATRFHLKTDGFLYHPNLLQVLDDPLHRGYAGLR